jgi:hypothetical protein
MEDDVPSPFPGMDPYLEHPALWPGVHTWLIASLADLLRPQVTPRYYVAVEERFYVADAGEAALVGAADALVVGERTRSGGANGSSGPGRQRPAAAANRSGVLVVEVPAAPPIRQRYLEVRVPATHEVITVVEVLSPANKRAGEGRLQYEAKRQATLASLSNLVEIDLLRAGEPLASIYEGQLLTGVRAGDYRVLISRASERPRAELHRMSLREPLPAIPLPLRPNEDEPRVNLQEVVRLTYERGSYDLRIANRLEPAPPLAPAAAAWADDLHRRQGRR